MSTSQQHSFATYFIGFLLTALFAAGEDFLREKWFPFAPNVQDDPNPTVPSMGHDAHGRIPMGVRNSQCDDGEIKLSVDWDENPVNYTCTEQGDDSVQFKPNASLPAVHFTQPIPQEYHAPHKCMNSSIEYDSVVPTYGTHRPLWAKYGEYTFVPKQRWIHNLEHGAIVALYHPCANQKEIALLKCLVKNCLYRHVISPYNLLSAERPLVLVSWGHRLEMSQVSPKIVQQFIKDHAKRGPERTSRDGQYDLKLEQHATVVSDIDDNDLCLNAATCNNLF